MRTSHVRGAVIVLLAVALLLTIPVALGRVPVKYLVLTFDFEGQRISSVSISVFEDTPLSEKYFFRGDRPRDDGLVWRMKDDGGIVLLEENAYADAANVARFDGRIESIEILKEGKILHTQRLSFCDNDAVCEPCAERGPDGSCRLVENALTCADCPRGGADGACDLFRDGVCDPDCGGVDSDCPGCSPDTCLSREEEQAYTSCAGDFKGEACQPGVECSGQFVYADDAGSLCCVGGICINEGNPPQCESLGGTFCWVDEWCTGGVIETDPTGYTCCIGGTCVPLQNVSTAGKASTAGEATETLRQVFSGRRGLVVLIAGEMILLISLISLLRRRRR